MTHACVTQESKRQPIFYSIVHFLSREELMATIQPILNEFTQIDDDSTMSSFLMYGSKTLNPLQNKEILNATLTFICSTGRFSRDSNS